MTVRRGMQQLASEASAVRATYQQVAAALDAPKRTVYGWLRGESAPQQHRLERLRAALTDSPPPWLSPEALARVLEAWDEAPPREDPQAVVISTRTRPDGVVRLTVEVRP